MTSEKERRALEKEVASDRGPVASLKKINPRKGELPMKPRIDITHIAPAAYKAVLGLEHYVRSSGIEPKTLELIKIRASQVNGCAYCIDMHTKDARAGGETEQRIYSLDAWRETPFYSDKERAALALTEAVTLIREGHVPDAVFEEARGQFSEAEILNLTLAIATINLWNRLAITLRSVPGEYQPSKSVHTTAVA
jgi:AhpD family alkylhydroperoxidase